MSVCGGVVWCRVVWAEDKRLLELWVVVGCVRRCARAFVDL